MKLQKRVRYRYSEAFKLEVVKEVEDGQRSIYQISRACGLGNGTVQGWIKRMGKLALLSKIVRVGKPDETDQIRELQRQIRELKESLADTQVKHLIAESYFEV